MCLINFSKRDYSTKKILHPVASKHVVDYAYVLVTTALTPFCNDHFISFTDRCPHNDDSAKFEKAIEKATELHFNEGKIITYTIMLTYHKIAISWPIRSQLHPCQAREISRGLWLASECLHTVSSQNKTSIKHRPVKRISNNELLSSWHERVILNCQLRPENTFSVSSVPTLLVLTIIFLYFTGYYIEANPEKTKVI